MKTQQKLALGLAGGLLIGATTGLLLTPRSGKENRQVLSGWANKLLGRVKRYRANHNSTEALNHQVGASVEMR